MVRVIKSPTKLIFTFVFTALLAGSFIWASFILGSTRVTDNLNSASIEAQLITRFGPALEIIQTQTPAHSVFGNGMGTTFYIPWFTYRGLDPVHSNIDSLYFTFYVKYGLISVLLILGFLAAAAPRNIISSSTRIMLGLMFFVSATPYQPFAVGLAFAALLPQKND